MPEFTSAYFKKIEYREEDVFEFPAGLPGFEQERAFLPLELPGARPLVLFQSLRTPGLCFLTLPVLSVDADYKLDAAPEDLALIGLPEGGRPRIGADVLCVAIVSVAEDRPATVNLLAPLVVNLATRRGVQAIQAGSGYSHQHELPVPEPEAAACS
ncbi:MAG: flagellar assembly protein FliW [Acidobacteriota bacterium]